MRMMLPSGVTIIVLYLLHSAIHGSGHAELINSVGAFSFRPGPDLVVALLGSFRYFAHGKPTSEPFLQRVSAHEQPVLAIALPSALQTLHNERFMILDQRWLF